MSVTSSGLSSINKTMSSASGLFLVIEWAILCSISVLPAFGGETINPLCPFPIGAVRSMILEDKSSFEPDPCSRTKRLFGNNGVKFSKRILFLACSGVSPLIASSSKSAKYLSFSCLGGLTFPVT